MNDLREQWLILISTPVYIIIIGLEIALSHLQHRKSYRLSDTVVNVYLMLLNGAIDLGFRVVYLVILNYFYLHAVTSIPGSIAYWAVLLLLEDFLYYWLHRFDHEIRLFWAIHVTHHSSKTMNFTVYLFYSTCIIGVQADRYSVYLCCNTNLGYFCTYGTD